MSSAVERECCRMPAKSVQPLRSLVYGLELITNNVLRCGGIPGDETRYAVEISAFGSPNTGSIDLM